jgi:hypothetical protein
MKTFQRVIEGNSKAYIVNNFTGCCKENVAKYRLS